LDEHPGEVEILAGGTDLVTSLKQGLTAPKRLVSLKSISELAGIDTAGDVLRVGAMTPLSDILASAVVRREFPSLIQTIEGIGSPQIINMGTIGGDLCQRPRCWYYRQGFGLLGEMDGKSLIPEGDNRYHAIFGNDGPAYFVNPSSLAPPLMALGATLEVAGPTGKTKKLTTAEFYRIPKAADEREIVLARNEVLTRILIPTQGLANASYEVRQRQGLDWPLVTASVTMPNRSSGHQAAIVLGHVAPIPWSVPEAAEMLNGQAPSAALAAKVGEAAAKGAKPLSRNGYKVQLVKVAVKRAILAAAGISEG
jgi:xanthine dehydrogenase YagS FAD-binding subunit